MTSSAKSRTLQSTILLRIAPFAALILLAVVGFSSYRVSQTLSREVQERVNTSAAHAAQQIDSNIAATVSACETVAANDLVVNGIVDIEHRNSTLRSYFKSLRLPGPKNQQIAMVDYKGRLIASTVKNAENYVGVAWFEGVMAGRQFVGTDGTTLTVAVPVRYADGAEAAIVSTFDLVEFGSDRFAASESNAIVFHSKGVVLYSTEPSLVVPAEKFQRPGGWLVGTSKLKSLMDYEVSYLESEQSALAAAREMSLSQLILFLVLFSGLIAAIRLAARLASQPLDKMLGQVGEIEKTGDLNLRVAQAGPKELQTLAQGFNGMLGKLQDTTVSQEKYRVSEERLSFAIEGTNDGLWDWDIDSSEVWFSPRYKAMLGYDDEEFPNLLTSFESHLHPEDAKSTWNAVEKHLEESVEYDVEHRLRMKSGDYCWVRARGAVTRDANGKPIRMSGSMQDITSEKESEAALIRSKQLAEESEQRFRALADSAAPLCWVTELDTSCSWLNKRWLDYSGKTMEEQIGFGWVEIVHPDDREQAKDTYLSAFEKQEPFVLYYRLLRHDGVYRWHTANATPRFDENGAFLGFVGMSFDSHEAKESREALESSELALKNVSESLRATLELLGKSDGVWDWKVGSQETVYTPGFRKILGFDGDDHEAFPDTMEALNSRIHPDDKGGLWEEIEQSFENREPFVFEFRVRCKDENYIWVRSRGSTSFDNAGNPVYLVGSIYDISAQKDVELERDRFLATAAELYAAVDLETMRWVKLSAAWSATLGYSLEAILETPMTVLHPKEEHEVIGQQVQRLQNGDSVRGWVSPTLHRDGSIRYIEWNIDPPIPGESIVYGAGRDVTKVREYLAQIEETTRELGVLNEQYEQSNNDLAQFAYVASHDLQEPLRAVGGFLQLLQRNCSEQLDETAKGYVEKSVAGAARMGQLINDLLDYSRVTNANSDYSLVDLSQCVAHALEAFAERIESSGVKVQVAKLPSVSGIKPLLVQMFQNLIGNAIKYRCEGSPTVEVWAEIEETEIVVHVKDNGIGIPEEYQDQVFALFKRLHHRAEYPGTGIGLAICQRVAARHGGSVSVKSNEGKGSCFSVRLRRDEA